jgi:bifunctional DNA-binding transcriptional regulator/antitoxin component of YhaV-PrlF toxin-antitoxin module
MPPRTGSKRQSSGGEGESHCVRGWSRGILRHMSNIVSTITSKWQVTIPEEVRKEITLKVGQRIAWEVDGDKLVGRRVRSISELSGCFKSDAPVNGEADSAKALAKAAIARHDRISKQ